MNITYEKTAKLGFLVLPASDSAAIIPDALHIELDNDKPMHKDRHEAAKQAEKNGIPIIHDIPGLEDWVYVDTPENRAIIHRALARYPRFDCRTWNNSEADSVVWTLENLIASDLEVSSDGESVEATFECWHEIFKKLGVNQEQVEEDAESDAVWINLYANYYPADSSLSMFFTVDDNKFNDHLLYEPSEEDRKVVIASMEAACQKECGCTMLELVARHAEEEAENSTETCKVVFRRTGGVADGYEFPVFLNVSRKAHCHEDPVAFFLTVEERQEAYDRAAKWVSEDSLKDYVIGQATPLRDHLILLVEATDGAPWVISSHGDFDQAHNAMRKRVSDVRRIDLDELTDSYLLGKEYDDDTCVCENTAWAKTFEDSPWDWAIFAIPPACCVMEGEKDPRYLLVSVLDREMPEPEVLANEEEAREKMFEHIGDTISESTASIRERYEKHDWGDGITVDEENAIVHHRDGTFAWTIVPVADFM